MNNQLKELYSSKWEKLSTSLQAIKSDRNYEIKPTNPFLLFVKDENDFINSDFRVMIFGQETNSWYGQFNPDMERSIANYDKFFNQGNCKRHGGQLYTGVERFIKLLCVRFPNKRIRYLRNNIIKIGKNGKKGSPPEFIFTIEKNHFQVIQEEIEITNPNLILFLTGPNYDHIMNNVFGPINLREIPGFTKRNLARLDFENTPFVFRTYHPNYLWRNNIDSYFNSILNVITSELK